VNTPTNTVPEWSPIFLGRWEEPLTGAEWEGLRYKFPVSAWLHQRLEANRVALRRTSQSFDGKAAHLNQKPLDLMSLIIEVSSMK